MNQITKRYNIDYIIDEGNQCFTHIDACTLKHAIDLFILNSENVKEITKIEFASINSISDHDMEAINAFISSTKNGLTKE